MMGIIHISMWHGIYHDLAIFCVTITLLWLGEEDRQWEERRSW